MEAPQEPNYVPNEPISAPEEEAGDNSGQVPPNEDSGENIPSTPVPEVPKEPSEGTGDSNSGTEAFSYTHLRDHETWRNRG